MLNLIRIAAVTGRVDPGSPAGCRKYLTEEIKKAGNNLSAQFYASANIRPLDVRHNPDHGREKPLFTPLVLW